MTRKRSDKELKEWQDLINYWEDKGLEFRSAYELANNGIKNLSELEQLGPDKVMELRTTLYEKHQICKLMNWKLIPESQIQDTWIRLGLSAMLAKSLAYHGIVDEKTLRDWTEDRIIRNQRLDYIGPVRLKEINKWLGRTMPTTDIKNPQAPMKGIELKDYSDGQLLHEIQRRLDQRNKG